MTAPGTVCVFAKPPRAGAVKTRLAARVGAERAAALARAFFADTWDTVGQLAGARRVLASTEADPAAFGLAQAELWLQGEGDLGERLERVMARALEHGPWVIAVGADCPILPLAALESARDALAGGPGAVLGPALDGGYYLIGLSRLPAGLLHGLPWSTPETLEATRARLAQAGLAIHRLEQSFDVDSPEDLDRLAARLAGEPGLAPHTARALAQGT